MPCFPRDSFRRIDDRPACTKNSAEGDVSLSGREPLPHFSSLITKVQNAPFVLANRTSDSMLGLLDAAKFWVLPVCLHRLARPAAIILPSALLEAERSIARIRDALRDNFRR